MTLRHCTFEDTHKPVLHLRSMASTLAQPERTTIGGSLEIPRMINGLWQLAGGHDKSVDIPNALKMMDPL
jgi:hypothetical protein